jgi:hypothetical protein
MNATAHPCPHCGALAAPGGPCPRCGGHVPTPAEIARVAAIGRRTWARRRLGELIRVDAPFQVVVLAGLGRCLVETFDD